MARNSCSSCRPCSTRTARTARCSSVARRLTHVSRQSDTEPRARARATRDARDARHRNNPFYIRLPPRYSCRLAVRPRCLDVWRRMPGRCGGFARRRHNRRVCNTRLNRHGLSHRPCIAHGLPWGYCHLLADEHRRAVAAATLRRERWRAVGRLARPPESRPSATVVPPEVVRVDRERRSHRRKPAALRLAGNGATARAERRSRS
jgi:hypothetical protein